MCQLKDNMDDIAFQICFGIFAILSFFATLAGLHHKESLGCILFRKWYYRFKGLCVPLGPLQPMLTTNCTAKKPETGLVRFQNELAAIGLSHNAPPPYSTTKARPRSRSESTTSKYICLSKRDPFTIHAPFTYGTQETCLHSLGVPTPPANQAVYKSVLKRPSQVHHGYNNYYFTSNRDTSASTH